MVMEAQVMEVPRALFLTTSYQVQKQWTCEIHDHEAATLQDIQGERGWDCMDGQMIDRGGK